MTWPITSDPARFDEAMEWFDERVPILEEDLVKLTNEQRANSFTISGATEMRVVQNVLIGIAQAVENKEPKADFRKRMKAQLKGDWTKKDSHRLDVIYVNAVQSSLNTGRFRQMKDPEVLLTRKDWMFDAVVDNRTTLVCDSYNGIVLPHDDPFWGSATPQLHHLCRSGIRALRERQVTRAGGRTTAEQLEGRTKTDDGKQIKAAPGFGESPATKKPHKPKKSDFHPEVWKAYQSKQRALRSLRPKSVEAKAAA